MKKFIVFLVMLFITTMIYAKQFCVRIDCYKTDKWGNPTVHINVEADSEEEAIELAMNECPYDNADEVEPIVEEIEDDE